MTSVDSYAQGASTPALLEETIGANLERTVAAHADREALVECASGRRWTWAELDRDVDAVARGLIGAGIEQGDRVGIWGPNSAEWTLVQLASAKVGAILVNVNPSYRTHEFSYAVNQSGMRLLVSATSFRTSDYRAMVEETWSRNETLQRVVYLDDAESWAGLLADGDDVTVEDLRARSASLRPGDPINIQYTSGTTGYPKGATLSHRNILNNGYLVGEVCGYTEEDRVCIPVPFYHCFGMVMGNLACTSHGATMVIPAPGFDPALTLRAVSEERCTSLYGVPTMFIAEWALPDLASYDLTSVRTGIMAGSPCPEEMMKKLISAGIDEMTIAYGMTETSPVSTQTRRDDSLERKVGTVGRVCPHLEIKIVDPVTGDTLPRGEAGEFCTRGYSVMLGYWQDEEKTREAVDPDGWMHTGDLGVMDDEGYVRITGRIKDMVSRGRENLYPR
jgi:fatty-acyl-CoA synthase